MVTHIYIFICTHLRKMSPFSYLNLCISTDSKNLHIQFTPKARGECYNDIDLILTSHEAHLVAAFFFSISWALIHDPSPSSPLQTQKRLGVKISCLNTSWL